MIWRDISDCLENYNLNNNRNMEILNATSEWFVPYCARLDTQYFKVATTEISHASRSPDNVFHDLTP